MTQITLDAVVADKLDHLNQVVQLCDPSGRVLGRFVPAMDMALWEPVSADISDEELDRREQSTEWFTTDEVLAHLKNLENN